MNAATTSTLSSPDDRSSISDNLRTIEAIRAIRTSGADLRSRVHALLQAAGEEGFTDEEMALLLSTKAKQVWVSTVRVKRRELIAAGMVADSGAKRTGSSGALATVWRAL